MHKRQHIAAINIIISLIVLGLKFLAFWLTDSVALYSDAIESFVNVATAIAALIVLQVSAKPADANHPYGHQKAEYCSVVLEGVLITLAALSIFRHAYLTFLAPNEFHIPIKGLAVSGVATLINGCWSYFLYQVGKRKRSPALIAEANHLLTDITSSFGVLVGLSLAIATGVALLDPLLAVGVALHILWSGWSLIRMSLSGLMDESAPDQLLKRIRELIAMNGDGAIEAHDLRTRCAGSLTFIDFHLVVPGKMSVSEAHSICDHIEEALKKEVEDALITIHVEPENKSKHRGILIV